MKTLRKAIKPLMALLFVVLLSAPIVGLFVISQYEQRQYQPAAEVVLRDYAYGDICQVTRTDIEQRLVVSGTVVSTDVTFIELNQYERPDKIRFTIEYGQLVNAGDVIGYYNGTPVTATQSGIVKDISVGEDSYIMLQSMDDLALKVPCYDETLLSALSADGLRLTSEEGLEFVVDKIDAAQDSTGAVNAYLTCENASLVYGKEYVDYALKTGRVFPQTLAVDKRCVYSYTGSSKAYVRTVDHDGVFVSEMEVTTGYTDGELICISGVDEGVLCDAGYKLAVEGGEG